MYSGEIVKNKAGYMADGYPAHVAEFMADNPPPPLEVWPWHWPVFQVFRAMQTQWRPGFSGPTGLDYAALKIVMDIHGIEDQTQMLDDIRVMEVETLKMIKENRA